MKQIAAACLATTLFVTPVASEDTTGFSLMEEGARLFMKGLAEEMDPALRELEDMARDLEPYLNDFVAEMGPALKGLMDEIEDWTLYHPPEILPNGDILIRRRTETDDPDPIDL